MSEYRADDNTHVYIILFALGNVFDVFVTYLAIKHFGAIEVNPFARALFGNVGMAGTMAIKIGVMAIVLSVCLYLTTVNERLAWAGRKVAIISAVFIWIVQAWNAMNLVLMAA